MDRRPGHGPAQRLHHSWYGHGDDHGKRGDHGAGTRAGGVRKAVDSVSARAVGVLTLAALAVLSNPAGVAVAASKAGPPTAPKASKDAVKEERAPGPRSGKGEGSQPVTVDADKMERFGKEGLVVFSGSVVARQDNSV